MVFANLPTRRGALIKETFSPFYNDFCVFEEEEEDDASIHSNQSDDIANSDTESEGNRLGTKKARKKGMWHRKQTQPLK